MFSLPFAFLKAGTNLSVLCLVGFGLLAMLCVVYVLEFSARAESAVSSESLAADEIAELQPAGPPTHKIGYRKLDFSFVSEVFGGWRMRVFTQIALISYCYGALWSYAAIFASSVDTLFFEYALGEVRCPPARCSPLTLRLCLPWSALQHLRESFVPLQRRLLCLVGTLRRLLHLEYVTRLQQQTWLRACSRRCCGLSL